MTSRGQSPNGRVHVNPGDEVMGPKGKAVVVRLDNQESHVQALLEWTYGKGRPRSRSWVDLNVVRPVEKSS